MKRLMKIVFLSAVVLAFPITNCRQAPKRPKKIVVVDKKEIIEGANQTRLYLDMLKNKNVAVVANNTSVIYKNNDKSQYVHLVDSLLSLNINIVKAFAPEHGFRGDADAGEEILDSRDSKTNLPVVSLYGNNTKPSSAQLENIDIVLFDIQDVGARFYTYLTTLHYVMESCAENGIPIVVLDRPNPIGNQIDGPVVQKGYESFVGLDPVPVVYGMTIGEYAKMLNGEKWLKNNVQCNLSIIPLKNYTHNSNYSLPIRPSPNLPNDKSINLYPSLCFFEGTDVSCGRGTEMQFQIFGSPDLPRDIYDFTFTPRPNYGAKKPKHMDEECYGLDLRKTKNQSDLNISWLINAYKSSSQKDKFFNRHKHFDILAGTSKLREQITSGKTVEEIKATWQRDLESFKKVREKYLMYL